ncbi:MAG: hypothetical protein AB2777_22110 [Candidatus Thiodiazotropha endolucinida]
MNRSFLAWDRNVSFSCSNSVNKNSRQKRIYSYHLLILVLFICAGCQTAPVRFEEKISSTDVKERRLIAGRSIDPNATTPPLVLVHSTAPPLGIVHPTWNEEVSSLTDSRLVAFQLQYENPAKFQHYINVAQKSKKIECRHRISLYLFKGHSDHILLIDFPPQCGGQIELSLSACKPALRLSLYDKCPSSEIRADKTLKVKLPETNQILYAGKLRFRLDDIYPHRGTANFPVYKLIDYSNEHNSSFDDYFGNSAPIKGLKLVYGKAKLTNRR